MKDFTKDPRFEGVKPFEKKIIAECERMRDISYDERVIDEADEKTKEIDNTDKNEKRWQPKKR